MNSFILNTNLLNTKKMKKIFIFLIALYALFSSATLFAQGNGATLTIFESRCVATGSITSTDEQGIGPFVYDFISYPVDYAYTGPTNTNVITALNPGNYTLRIIDQGANNAFTDYNVVVPGNYIEPTYNPTTTGITNCKNGTNGTISGALIDGRAPFSYEIIAGPMGVGTINGTGTFTGLSSGTYTVRGYDSCSNFQTRQVSIDAFDFSLSGIIVTKTGCDQYSFNAVNINPTLTGFSYSVKNNSGITIATGNTLPITFTHSDATIGAAKVCVIDSCGYSKCNSFTFTNWSIASCNIILTACNTYEATATVSGNPIGPLQYFIRRDLGDTVWSNTVPFTYTKMSTQPTNNGNYSTKVYVKDACGVIKSCGSYYQDISGSRTNSYENCTTSQVTLSPGGFYQNPVTYTMTSPVLGAPQSNPQFTGLVDGTYAFNITDACGHINTQTITLSHNWNLQSLSSAPDCLIGTAYTSYKIPSNAANPITIDKWDATFSNLLNTASGNYAGATQTEGGLAPNTTYNYIITDNCGRKDTANIATPNGSAPMEHSTTVTPLCVNHGNINITWNTFGLYQASISYGKIGQGMIAKIENQSNAGTSSFNNVDTGTYWVQYKPQYCGELYYDTVTILPYVLPKLRKSIAFDCVGGNINAIGSVKDGLAPYTYEIIQTFPIDNPVPPQASNIFTIAGSYTLIRMRVVDACGNTSLQDIAVRPPAKPILRITSGLPICNLSSLTLYVDSFIVGQVYEWKNPAGNVIGTDATLSLNNLNPATDTGTYTCHVQILGTCYDALTSFHLRAKDFGCYAKLGNYVWLDVNKDGIQDANEVGVSGITVTLYDNTNNIVSATVTDAYGYYLFENLEPSTYHVGFSLPTNYVFSAANQGADDATDSDPNVNTGMTTNYTLVAGDSNMTVDAGIYFIQPVKASLGDFVWNDTNQNGVQDPGEVGISGITVTLYDNLGNPIASTVTDATGHYFFSDLDPATYSVGFSQPIGYVFSPQDQGNDATDSDVNPLTGHTGNVTLSAGENNLTIDAGLYAQPNNSASLGNFVWNDINNDGIQSANEGGVPNITVTLYAADAITVISTTTTDVFGYYIFNNLTPASYVVGFSNLPANFVFSNNDQGGDDAVDSDPNTGTGLTPIVTLAPGENNMTVDAGIYNPTLPIGALGNFVWYDYNKNGMQDEGENGVPGVTVRLYDDASNLLATTATNAEGLYIFNNLSAGNYVVEFTNLPVGYSFTNQDLGGNDAIDSDPNKGTGFTNVISLALAEINLTVDAGIVFSSGRSGTASLGDRVWNDENINGIQDAGEVGVAGVTVTLYASDEITILKTMTTDALGNYLFTDLPAGSYVVGFSNIPAGFTFSDANQGADDELDADADALSGGKTGIYVIAEGEDNLSIDAGIHLAAGLASLGNFVWNDLNLDGIQDANEPGVPGVTVTLYNENNIPIGVTTTDANGLYQFTGLIPGNYYVEFTNLPSGYEFTDVDAGGNLLESTDSDADPITGVTEWVNLLAGQNYPDLDAGIFTEKAGLGNFVWNDYDNDGIQDPGEPGIPGITVILYAADGITPIASAITDANGAYNFVNLNPGTYVVGFSNIPLGATFSPANQGGNDALDSDADQNTGKTSPITLVAGEYNPTIDAGIHIPQGAGLGNYVWFDLNADGIQDANEPGVPGVTVTLYNANGVAIQSAITTQNGYYSFPNLAPGTYSVGFSTLPPNYGFTTANAGGNDALDNDVTNIITLPNGLPSFGQTDQVTIVAGEYNPTIDAGLKIQFPTGIVNIIVSASLNGETAKVSWITTDEKDVKNFSIERSIDNRIFESVSTKQAVGNTIGNTNYSINDNVKSLMKESRIYYRIKVYDIDGKYVFSNTVNVNPTQNTSDEVVIYPTPFSTSVNIAYNATIESELQIELTDLAGKVISKQVNTVGVGQNNLTIKNLGTLSIGSYYIKIVDINLNKTFVNKVSKK